LYTLLSSSHHKKGDVGVHTDEEKGQTVTALLSSLSCVALSIPKRVMFLLDCYMELSSARSSRGFFSSLLD
jgi:hypothetical protein